MTVLTAIMEKIPTIIPRIVKEDLNLLAWREVIATLITSKNSIAVKRIFVY